jgi:MerR family copper efflux transcriptional regulator
MNIGEAARSSGVPAKTIRYYESIGLIPPASRRESGYRSFGQVEIDTLRFVQRARSLGFSVKDVARLLDLWRDRSRASGDVKALAMEQVGEIDRKVAELRSMRDTLQHLAEQCHGDHRPDCPILDGLAGDSS